MKIKQEICTCLSGKLKEIFGLMDDKSFEKIEEIRIRAGQPLLIRKSFTDYFVTEKGLLQSQPSDCYCPLFTEIQETLALLSRYSFYAFAEELKQGFFTIEGGHRIGITGKTILENGQVKTIKNISSLNIRIATAVKGCADEVMPYLRKEGKPVHTLIVSPPGCGKTTLLRDIIRQFSQGDNNTSGINVGVIDERGEIAGTYMGIFQNDLGWRTDVLDCCPKAEGMMMLLRSMSPSVIAVDEIGSYDDFCAIESILHGGVTLLCTVHGNDIQDIKKRPYLSKLLKPNVFEAIILLSGSNAGRITTIYNNEFAIIPRKQVSL